MYGRALALHRTDRSHVAVTAVSEAASTKWRDVNCHHYHLERRRQKLRIMNNESERIWKVTVRIASVWTEI
jgi:uncharacterized protein (DUF2384 family)